MKQLWDFLDRRGRSVILEWAKQQTKRDRATLNQRFDRLMQVDYELAINSNLLAGPIYKHVYKMQIHGEVQLRPLLCRGPISNESEYTLLRGALERDRVLTPGAKEEAELNRAAVVASPAVRRRQHARIP